MKNMLNPFEKPLIGSMQTPDNSDKPNPNKTRSQEQGRALFFQKIREWAKKPAQTLLAAGIFITSASPFLKIDLAIAGKSPDEYLELIEDESKRSAVKPKIERLARDLSSGIINILIEKEMLSRKKSLREKPEKCLVVGFDNMIINGAASVGLDEALSEVVDTFPEQMRRNQQRILFSNIPEKVPARYGLTGDDQMAFATTFPDEGDTVFHQKSQPRSGQLTDLKTVIKGIVQVIGHEMSHSSGPFSMRGLTAEDRVNFLYDLIALYQSSAAESSSPYYNQINQEYLSKINPEDQCKQLMERTMELWSELCGFYLSQPAEFKKNASKLEYETVVKWVALGAGFEAEKSAVAREKIIDNYVDSVESQKKSDLALMDQVAKEFSRKKAK